MISKKAQANSMEIMFIVAIVMVFTMPFIIGILDNLNDRTRTENKVQTAILVRNAIETVANLGPGNTVSITSTYDFSILENYLILAGITEEDGISLPLLPTIEDTEISQGPVQVINSNDGIVIVNYPVITSAKVIQQGAKKGRVRIKGEHFSEDSVVYFRNRKASHTYISDKQLEFNPHGKGKSQHGTYTVYVNNVIDDQELVSNTVNVVVGALIGGGNPPIQP